MKSGQAVVGSGRTEYGEDADGGSGGGTDRRVGEYGRKRDRYGLNKR